MAGNYIEELTAKRQGFSGPDPGDLALIGDGNALAAVMPYLEHELAAMSAALEKRIYADIDGGRLTAERAFDAWLEKRAYARLLRRLTKQIRAGNTASVRVAPYMDGGNGNG